MKRIILFITAFLMVLTVFSQVTIRTTIYTVSFNTTQREPDMIAYKLYKGGGDCDRSGFAFKNDRKEITTATNKDYAGSVYDKGHLANAEDFAFDCVKDEQTFRYYNCLPQTPNLNRGIWKKNETQIRKWSQQDSLLIICGGVYSGKKMKSVGVPDYCWKVVESLTTRKVLFCGWFSNTTAAKEVDISVEELQKRVPVKIILK